MGTAVLMDKLGLKLIVHDITYVYRLQKTGRNQYTLVTRNSDRKLVTGLPNSNKGRDEDFLSGSTVKDSRQTEIQTSLIPFNHQRPDYQLSVFLLSSIRLLNQTTTCLSRRRSINIGSVLGTIVPESSEASPPPPPPGFFQGEDVIRKRKRGEEENDEAAGHISHKKKHQNNEPKIPWNCEFSVEGRLVDEDDSVVKGNEARAWGGQVVDAVGKALLLPRDMRIWQEDSSERLIENLKRDSVLAVQGIFEASSRLLETERLLHESLEENDRLKDFEKKASVMIQAAESKHKSAEVGELKNAVNEARKGAQKAEEEAQAYYDQGFDEAANSLKSQLANECNKHFLQGWCMALDKAGVDDASELYDLGSRHQPFRVNSPEEREGRESAEGSMDLESHEALREPEAAEDLGDPEVDGQAPVVEIREGQDGSDGKGTLNVVD
uniref:Uncharacterized protein n=1 Tax=Fagus sylvatica TaxID=28930 RepID=A0A2N9FR87_FAGSY